MQFSILRPSAANAFFKTSSGLCLDREEEIIRSLRSQYDELARYRDGQMKLSGENLSFVI
ncbi:MAG: hypothetical protein GDA43_23550 [Hormoscilla sp. SP5CHS1]|nr:hypothetical protein [Hormoscilla sp. SP12CHS1]MBC6455790.1 hypothetical protein [Hormoscilla sp. SP5CHS1]